MGNIQIPSLPQLIEEASRIKYFEEYELNSLIKEFQDYYDNAKKRKNAIMPLNHIQALLGHLSILNTSVYLVVTGK